jgi:hypothetical protein
VVLVVSGRTCVTDTERRYRLALLEIAPEEKDAAQSRRTLRYAHALGVFGVVMTLGMLRFYVLPYQQALLPEGEAFRFDWFSGEAWFAYGWAIVFVFLGWLMRRAICREYLAAKSG